MISAMQWPIKTSFLEYLAALQDGVIETDGIAQTSGGFQFPRRGGKTELAFNGTVRFTAHAGALSVELSSPRIARHAGKILLYASDASGEVPIARVLDYPDDDAALLRHGGELSDVALTLEGAKILGDVYSPWTRISAITLLAR